MTVIMHEPAGRCRSLRRTRRVSMILPASQTATLALLVISLICWGSWANTLKLAGKWRFELYYYDFALGFAVLALVAAFTAGSLNSGELTFQDNFLITG